ncbi:MAG: hypothetical protein ACOCRX_10285 [Candidatus Woesearchaeota archaeon]
MSNVQWKKFKEGKITFAEFNNIMDNKLNHLKKWFHLRKLLSIPKRFIKKLLAK